MVAMATKLGAAKYLLNKIHKLVMCCGRLCYGSYGYKVRCSKILEQNKFDTHSQLIVGAVAKFAIKIAHFKKPTSLVELLNFPSRSCKPILLKNPPTSTHSRKYNYFDKIWKIYNGLPTYLKNENVDLKSRLRQLCVYLRTVDSV